MTFNHSLENTIDACGITTKTLQSALVKIKTEANNEPFTPYSAEEQRAILLLAISSNIAPALASTLFLTADSDVYDALETPSQLVEALEKYPPTADAIFKSLAVKTAMDMFDD